LTISPIHMSCIPFHWSIVHIYVGGITAREFYQQFCSIKIK
jgi:hypothetical protein